MQDDRGAAVVIALLLTILLALLGAGLLTLSNTEALIAASYRQGQEAAYGAEAALERALTDLAIVADWSTVVAAPPGNLMSTFVDGQTSVRMPDGSLVSLTALTAERQRDSDEHAGPAIYRGDSPQWRLYAHAPLHALVPAPAAGTPLYLIVWVADDGVDGDGDAARDSNGRVHVHAAALGGRGARRAVEAAIERSGDGVLRLIAWRRVP